VATGGFDGTVVVSDTRPPSGVRRIGAHAGVVLAVAWSPAGDVLTSLGSDRIVRCWDPISGRELDCLRLPDPEDLPEVAAFSADGRRLFVGTRMGMIAEFERQQN
jgi:WD40 repeat protein